MSFNAAAACVIGLTLIIGGIGLFLTQTRITLFSPPMLAGTSRSVHKAGPSSAWFRGLRMLRGGCSAMHQGHNGKNNSCL